MRSACFLIFGASLLYSPYPAASAEQAGGKRDPLLMQPVELAEKLKQTNLRILDGRSAADYDKGHIPGAVRVDVDDWKSLALAAGGLSNASGWSKKVGGLGISNTTRVVVYGDRISNAARIWWLLKYVGVENASLLDGGWTHWENQNRPTEERNNTPAAAEFQPRFDAGRLAEMQAVKQSAQDPKVKVIDTRSDAEFAAGRIPDSVHLEWKHLLDDNGRFKSKAQLREIFREQGVRPTETAVCY